MESNHLIATYRTCTHWTIDVSYDAVTSKHMLKTHHNIKQLRCMPAEQLKN